MGRLVILSKNYTGYWGAVVMNHYDFDHLEDTFVYVSGFKEVSEIEDLREYDEVWIVGVPYYNSYEWVIKERICLDAPVRHFASYGDTFSRGNRKNITWSQVSEVETPLISLVEALDEHKEENQRVFPDEKGRNWVDLILENINRYHTYSPEHVSGLPWEMVLLSEHFREGLSSIYDEWKSLKDNLVSMSDIRVRLRENANEYIFRKVDSCRIKEVSYADKRLFVFMLYAENHVNEISHQLLNSVAEYGVPTAVLVGKHTRGGDLFSIRTSEGVSAAGIADVLSGKRSGKDRVGSVFLPATLDVTSQAVAFTLESGFRENRL